MTGKDHAGAGQRDAGQVQAAPFDADRRGRCLGNAAGRYGSAGRPSSEHVDSTVLRRRRERFRRQLGQPAGAIDDQVLAIGLHREGLRRVEDDGLRATQHFAAWADRDAVVAACRDPGLARNPLERQPSRAQRDRRIGHQLPDRVRIRRSLLGRHKQARRDLDAGVRIGRPSPDTGGRHIDAVILRRSLVFHQHAVADCERDTVDRLQPGQRDHRRGGHLHRRLAVQLGQLFGDALVDRRPSGQHHARVDQERHGRGVGDLQDHPHVELLVGAGGQRRLVALRELAHGDQRASAVEQADLADVEATDRVRDHQLGDDPVGIVLVDREVVERTAPSLMLECRLRLDRVVVGAVVAVAHRHLGDLQRRAADLRSSQLGLAGRGQDREKLIGHRLLLVESHGPG